MEMIFKNVSYLKYLKDISINFNSGNIYGIYGKNNNILASILNEEINDYKGQIIKKEVNNISYINSLDNIFFTNKVSDEFEFINSINNNINDIKQVAIELFYKLDLDEELYNRKIYDLSRSEKYLIKIVLGLLNDPDVIIFNNVFNGLDLKYRKKLTNLVDNLSKNKIIILIDDNPNIIYYITSYVYIIKDSLIAISGKTNNVYQDVERFLKLKIDIPYLVDIVYKVKEKKGIKLEYRKDVRDTMKDIFRNV